LYNFGSKKIVVSSDFLEQLHDFILKQNFDWAFIELCYIRIYQSFLFCTVEVVRMNGETEHMNGGMESPDKEVNGEKEEQTDKDGEKEGDENKDQEVLLIQDTGFNVTITCPGVEEFELPVSVLYLLYYKN
jgi:hypothetical protein